MLIVGSSFSTINSVQGNLDPIVHFADSLTMPLPAIPLPSASQLAPVSGVLRVLVIAAAFSDANNTKSIGDIKQAFFGTVSSYYDEISYGAVSLQGDVIGWYKLNYSMVYYGRDCIRVDDADCTGTPTSWWFARDAAKAASQDVNFTNYDYFVFVHSGVGQESTKNRDNVWSVAYLGGVPLRTKDRTIEKYNIVPEDEANGAVPIGVYAHEFGHMIGLPDLYNTASGMSVMGPWSLMDKGLWNGDPPGSSPAHMEAWSKLKLGWLNGSMVAVTNDGVVGNHTIEAIETRSNSVHVVKIPISTTSTQYYLLEVRQHIGFDQALPAVGVLITHVDEKSYSKRVTVVDGHPNIAGLANATWDVGQTFTDTKNNIAISINAQVADAFQITVNRLGPMPDLAVARISTQPSEIKPNTTVAILIDIVNQGTAGATNIPVQVYMNGQPFANQQVTLGPGGRTEISLTWVAIAGTHTIRVLIDPYNVLNEMNKANDQATYTLNVGPTLIITVPLNATIGNATAWVRVNGVLYNLNGSHLRTSVVAGLVTIEVEPSVYTTNASRLTFTGWSDGSSENPRQMTIEADTFLTAILKMQYLLTINPNGGTTTQSGWFDANTTVTVTANALSNVAEQSSRMVFKNWSGDVNSTSTSISVTMTRPINLNAYWKHQYYLNVISPAGVVSGSGWYDAGSSATISVESTVLTQNKTRQVFTGWAGGATGQSTTETIVVNAPTVVQASWKIQYQVQVLSLYGNPQGSGWQDAGTELTISIEPRIEYPNRTRRIFAGWIGDYSGVNSSFTLIANGPNSLTAGWTTQYHIAFRVAGLPNSTYVKLNVNNAYHDVSVTKPYQDWFDQGAELNPMANQTLTDGFLQFRLSGFRNSTGGTVVPPFTVNRPMDYTLVYQQTFPLIAIPGFPFESIVLGLLLGLLALGQIGHRRRLRIMPETIRSANKSDKPSLRKSYAPTVQTF